MRYLLNSAVIVESRVGYQETLDQVAAWTVVRLPLNTATVRAED